MAAGFSWNFTKLSCTGYYLIDGSLLENPVYMYAETEFTLDGASTYDDTTDDEIPDDGSAGDTGDLAVWKNMKAVKASNVYFGINEDQYNMAFTAMGKELYLEKLANAILNHGDVE